MPDSPAALLILGLFGIKVLAALHNDGLVGLQSGLDARLSLGTGLRIPGSRLLLLLLLQLHISTRRSVKSTQKPTDVGNTPVRFEQPQSQWVTMRNDAQQHLMIARTATLPCVTCGQV